MFTQVFGTQCADPPSVRLRSRFVTGLVKFVFLLSMGCFGTLAHADMIYVANSWANTVSVTDNSINGMTNIIPVGSNPAAMVASPNGTRIYVANCHTDNTVSVIDTQTNLVVATVPVGIKPCGVAINPSGTRVYVTNYNNSNQINSNVSVIDTNINKVVATVTVGAVPTGVVVNSNGTKVYVANSTGRSISVIDASNNTVVSTIAIAHRNPPGSVVVTPNGTRLYVAYYGNSIVDVIDTNTNSTITQITVGTSPTSMAVNSVGTRVYVANRSSNNVSVIDTKSNSVIATISVGSQPVGIALNPAGTHLYVANYASNTVSVMDTSSNSIIKTMTVGIYRPYSLAVLAAMENKFCKDPAKYAKYSIATGRVSIPFTDLPALKEDSPEATGDMAVFKNLRLQFFKDQDFKVVTTTVTPDTSKEPVGDPCHAVYTYATRTLRIPKVEVPSIISTFPAITEGKPINIYEVTLQHIETNPVDLGIVRIKDATLIETIQ